jgi:hypothetical protein
MDKLVRRSGSVLLLWLTLVSGLQAYDGWSSGARRAQWVEVSGRILATGDTSARARAHPSDSPTDYYLLLHRQGSLVLQSLAGQSALLYHRLWLKGKDRVFARLLFEEPLFVEVRLSGLLREHQPDTGILELAHIEIVPNRSHITATVSGS